MSARFASPWAGGARTRTLRTGRPLASCSIPSMVSRPLFGERRKDSADRRAPIATAGHEAASPGEYPGQETLDEQERDDEDRRRDVDASEIGKQRSDRLQGRLGHPVKEIPDRRHDVVVPVHHVECDQPGEQSRGNEEQM